MEKTRNGSISDQRLLRPAEAAKHLGICTSYVYKLAYEGEIPTIRMKRPGKRRGAVRFDIQDLDEYIKRSRVGAMK